MTAQTLEADAPSSAASCPDPAVMRGVIPYMNLDGRAAQAADFYARAFGARDLGRIPDQENPGRLMHAQIEINGGALMMTDCRAPGDTESYSPKGFTLQLVVPDGDDWWSRALAAGCAVVTSVLGRPLGMLRDPFGFHWAIDEPAA